MQRSTIEENIKKLQEGDMSALDGIYSATNRQVFAAALAIMHDYQLAEDVMQETYVRFVQSVAGYKFGSSPSAYLLTICRNTCFNMLKRRGRELATDYSENESLIGTCQFESGAAKAEAVEELLKGLDADEREVLMLKVYGGLKHREIASAMKKPLGTVLWLYSRALKKAKINAEKTARKEAREL